MLIFNKDLDYGYRTRSDGSRYYNFGYQASTPTARPSEALGVGDHFNDGLYEFEWNSTAWLSRQVFEIKEENGSLVSPTFADYKIPTNKDKYNIYLISSSLSAYISTANNASNYWQCQCISHDGFSGFTPVGGILTTAGGNDAGLIMPINLWDTVELSSLNTLVNLTALNNRVLFFRIININSPGSISYGFDLKYKLVKK